MNEDGTMARGQDLIKFADKFNLKIGKIEDLISYRLKKEKLIKLKKTSKIKIQKQIYKIKIYENIIDGSEHFALIKGNIKKNRHSYMYRFNTREKSSINNKRYNGR